MPTPQSLSSLAATASDARFKGELQRFDQHIQREAKEARRRTLDNGIRTMLAEYGFKKTIVSKIAKQLSSVDDEPDEPNLADTWFATAVGKHRSAEKIASRLYMAIDKGKSRATLGPQGSAAFRLKGYTSLAHVLTCAASGVCTPDVARVAEELFTQQSTTSRRAPVAAQRRSVRVRNK
jgi:hypothetical protein